MELLEEKPRPSVCARNMNVSMCEVVLYQEHFPTIADVEKICKEHNTIKKYAISLHDKDKKVDGELKKAHYHVILHFGRSVDTKNCENWFNCSSQAIEKIKGRWKDALLYLIHKNSPNDFQYPPEGVRANFDYMEELRRAENADRQKTLSADLANAIMRGEKTYRQAQNELLQFDYSPTASRYLRDAFNIYSRSAPVNRDITVVMIFGASSTGKTALAQELCKADGVDYCVSASGQDLLSDYMGESALILDDVREETFSFVEWLKLLDNHTGSPIRSRYSNKVFLGKYIYLCISTNPVMWFVGSREERWQFFRRVGVLVKVTKETVTHYEGFRREGNYIDFGVPVMEYKNPITLMYQQNASQTSYASRFAQNMAKIYEKATTYQMQDITDMKEIEQK